MKDGWNQLRKEIKEERHLDHHFNSYKQNNHPKLYEEKGGKSTPQIFVLIIFSLAMNCDLQSFQSFVQNGWPQPLLLPFQVAIAVSVLH